MTARAFWLDPDWSGGDNLRDPGTVPFWVKPPLRLAVGGGRHIPLLRKGPPAPAAPWGPAKVEPILTDIPMRYGRTRLEPNFIHWEQPEHVCGPFIRLWTGYEFCKECEKPRYDP